MKVIKIILVIMVMLISLALIGSAIQNIGQEDNSGTENAVTSPSVDFSDLLENPETEGGTSVEDDTSDETNGFINITEDLDYKIYTVEDGELYLGFSNYDLESLTTYDVVWSFDPEYTPPDGVSFFFDGSLYGVEFVLVSESGSYSYTEVFDADFFNNATSPLTITTGDNFYEFSMYFFSSESGEGISVSDIFEQMNFSISITEVSE